MTEQNPVPPPQQPDAAPPSPPQPGLNYATPEGAAIEMAPEAKTFGMLCHLSALAGFIGIPFGHVIGPLVFWLLKRDQYPYVNDQGKESLNFQITMTIAMIVSALLICVAVGIFLLIAVALVDLILVIVASIQSSSGKPYRYPLTLRLIK